MDTQPQQDGRRRISGDRCCASSHNLATPASTGFEPVTSARGGLRRLHFNQTDRQVLMRASWIERCPPKSPRAWVGALVGQGPPGWHTLSAASTARCSHSCHCFGNVHLSRGASSSLSSVGRPCVSGSRFAHGFQPTPTTLEYTHGVLVGRPGVGLCRFDVSAESARLFMSGRLLT